ncbi:rod-binding protein [Microvirga puerhi]|uniref:Rod-binding protein n=1 Tax=Microvirga puerhi TaxID=2876078 RepID=A0ABS7VUT9_9HYPH|nr:rod-binding protein [Microvirga puerhi]MBZ6079334.1 rod-binding protein [Microvirga puerhi]
MGISPPSDIIQDVARAADPMKLQAASRKLMELSNGVEGPEFAETFRSLQNVGSSFIRDPVTAQVMSRNHATLASSGKAGSAYQQFEAFVLQSFIESMLPKDASATFGKGTAGSVWRSMMAEQIGSQIAKAGGIGIASRLLAGRATDKGTESLMPGAVQVPKEDEI